MRIICFCVLIACFFLAGSAIQRAQTAATDEQGSRRLN
jgi:hypothetical protein